MKCISLLQPWASLVILGAKRYETRNWGSQHRGPLLIHASRGMPPHCQALTHQEPFRSALAKHGLKAPSDLPRGVILGTVRLIECTRTDLLDADLSDQEKAFGNFELGRWAWLLTDPTPWSSLVPLTGKLGVYDVPDALVLEAAHEA